MKSHRTVRTRKYSVTFRKPGLQSKTTQSNKNTKAISDTFFHVVIVLVNNESWALQFPKNL